MNRIQFHDTEKYSDSSITKNTSFKIIEIIEALDYLSSRDEFMDVIRTEIRKLIPHDMTIFGVGEWKTLRVDGKINVDYPDKFLNTIITPSTTGVHVNSPVVKAATLAPQFVEVKTTKKFDPKFSQWMEAARNFEIHNLFAKGRKHPGGSRFTYHCYTNSHLEWNDKRRRIINILTPHIDNAVLKIVGMETINKTVEVTLRERQILQYVHIGLKNEEIAKELYISLHTVKNHIKNILAKLKVKNRTQAVTKAIDFDLIDA